MQVTERRQHLDGVRDRLRQRHRTAAAPGVLADLLERLAAHVLHHDVPGRLPRPPVRVLDEVVDPHDVRVLDLREEAALGDRGRHGVRVAGVEQTLEDHPAVGRRCGPWPGRSSRARRGRGSPAPRTGRPPGRRAQLRAERVPGAAVAAEPLASARAGRPGRVRRAARSLRRSGGSPGPAGRRGWRWPGRGTGTDGTSTSPAPATPGRPAAGPPGPPGAAGTRGPAAAVPSRSPPCPNPPDPDPPDAIRDAPGPCRGGGQAADVAVTVLDRPAAAGTGAHRHPAPLVSRRTARGAGPRPAGRPSGGSWPPRRRRRAPGPGPR